LRSLRAKPLSEFLFGRKIMPKDDAFFIEEFKSIRQEITTKLKDRLEFSRWGLIGGAALYSYIFSNPGKPALFWVPVGLALAMIFHLNEEHRMVAIMADYIRKQFEPWVAGIGETPKGWETYLIGARNDRRWQPLWRWSPMPLWLAVLGLTFVFAAVVSSGQLPSLIEVPASPKT
jgi:hypothetical protein